MNEVRPGSHIAQLEKELAESNTRELELMRDLKTALNHFQQMTEIAKNEYRRAEALKWQANIIIFLNVAVITWKLIGWYK